MALNNSLSSVVYIHLKDWKRDDRTTTLDLWGNEVNTKSRAALNQYIDDVTDRFKIHCLNNNTDFGIFKTNQVYDEALETTDTWTPNRSSNESLAHYFPS